MKNPIIVIPKSHPTDSCSAIQFKGDKNKFEIVFFFKGYGKYEVEFHINKTPMIQVHKYEPQEYSLSVNKNDWVINSNGQFSVVTNEKFLERYDIYKEEVTR